MNSDTCFPVIAIERGKVGETSVGFNAAVQVVETPPGAQHQIRFSNGHLFVWVLPPADQADDEFLLELSVAHAAMSSFDEDRVQFTGVEVQDFKSTNRPVRVTFTGAHARQETPC